MKNNLILSILILFNFKILFGMNLPFNNNNNNNNNNSKFLNSQFLPLNKSSISNSFIIFPNAKEKSFSQNKIIFSLFPKNNNYLINFQKINFDNKKPTKYLKNKKIKTTMINFFLSLIFKFRGF